MFFKKRAEEDKTASDRLDDHFSQLPLDERRSGIFSNESITQHHSLMRNIFFSTIKRRLFISLINHIVSYASIVLVIIVVAKNNEFPVDELKVVFMSMVLFWMLTYVCFSTIKIYEYPSRKNAIDDLELYSYINGYNTRRITL